MSCSDLDSLHYSPQMDTEISAVFAAENDTHTLQSITESPFPEDVPLLRSCENCRRKKRKCSGHKTTCTRCKAQGEHCVYRPTARFFKPARKSAEIKAATHCKKQRSSAFGQAYSGHQGGVRRSRGSLDVANRSSAEQRPRAMSAISALKKIQTERQSGSLLAPGELVVAMECGDVSASPSPAIGYSQMLPAAFDRLAPVDLMSGGEDSGLVADGLSYMGGLAAAMPSATAANDMPASCSYTMNLPISMSPTHMMLNGQDFDFNSVSSAMMLTGPTSTLLMSPTSVNQHQFIYQNNYAAAAAMVQSPAMYGDDEHSQMTLVSAFNRNQQTTAAFLAAAASAASGTVTSPAQLTISVPSHMYSPPLSTSSFCTGMPSTPPLAESVLSSYLVAMPAQQSQGFEMWPPATSAFGSLNAGQMTASMLASPLIANMSDALGNGVNIGLDFLLPSAKSNYSEWST
ncbi:hypothetical protein GGF37_004592 [Kickxella alabastrina]|nr:hypothetical protein GGF37_004592 [Kickxella alabastrina]